MSNRARSDLVFDALGDPLRRRIVELLGRGPVPVGRLAEQLPIGRPAVSKHLGILSRAELVQHRTEGTRHLYALAPGGSAEARRWLEHNWDATLAAFATHVHDLAGGDDHPTRHGGSR